MIEKSEDDSNICAQIAFTTSTTKPFHTPLSVQAYQEYQALQEIIQQTQISSGEKDNLKYIWGDAICTSSKFYDLPYSNVEPPKPFIWI
jgi:hypothetical protein